MFRLPGTTRGCVCGTHINSLHFTSMTVRSVNLIGFGKNTCKQMGTEISLQNGQYNIPLPAEVTAIKHLFCGVSASGFVDSYGRMYIWGKLATNVPEARTYSEPTLIKYFQRKNMKIEAVSCRNMHVAVVTNDHRVFAWGDNSQGQLPTTDKFVSESHPIAIKLPSGTRAKAVACGGYFTVILTETGSLYGFGVNTNSVIGDNAPLIVATIAPIYFDALTTVEAASVHAGWSHAVIIGTNDCAYSWGRTSFARLGREGGESPRPISFARGTAIRSIACSDTSTYIISGDSTGYACGWNNSGENGAGDLKMHGKMRQMQTPNLDKIVSIAGGGQQILALTTKGTILAAGNNASNCLGLGNNVDESTLLVEVKGIQNAVAVATGEVHSLIATSW